MPVDLIELDGVLLRREEGPSTASGGDDGPPVPARPDPERPAHERVHAAEVRVGPGFNDRGVRQVFALRRGREPRRAEAEVARVEPHRPVRQRIGDPGRRGARRPARGDRVQTFRRVEVDEAIDCPRAPPVAAARPATRRSPWPYTKPPTSSRARARRRRGQRSRASGRPCPPPWLWFSGRWPWVTRPAGRLGLERVRRRLRPGCSTTDA